MNIEVLDFTLCSATVKVDGVEVESHTNPSSCRTVFIFDTFVIKFDAGSQNEEELSFYNDHLESQDAKFFPKLLASGYFQQVGVNRPYSFIVQERVIASKRQAKRKDFQRFLQLKRKYWLHDILFAYKRDGEGNQRFFNCMMTKAGIKIYDIGMHGM